MTKENFRSLHKYRVYCLCIILFVVITMPLFITVIILIIVLLYSMQAEANHDCTDKAFE